MKPPPPQRVPHIVPLPKELVWLLEERQHSGRPVSASWKARWRGLVDELKDECAELFCFAGHEQLEKLALRSQDLLERLEGEADTNSLETLQANCYELFRCFHHYDLTRQSLLHSEMPAVDDCILAIMACQRGHLDEEAIVDFFEGALEDVEYALSLYEELAPSFSPDLSEAIQKGVESFEEARNQASLPDPSWESIGANLQNGATLMGHLIRWERAYESERDSDIPKVGSEVNALIEELKSAGELSAESLSKWQVQDLPKLLKAWPEVRDSWFAPTTVRSRLAASIECLLSSLQKLPVFDSSTQEQILNSVQRHFRDLAKSRFHLDLLGNHPEAWIGDLFLAALNQGVPNYQLQETADVLRQEAKPESGQLIELFLKDGDLGHLIDGLEIHLRECEEYSAQKEASGQVVDFL